MEDNPNMQAFEGSGNYSFCSHGRGIGKVVKLLRWSVEHDARILCETQEQVDSLKSTAAAIGIEIPEPMLAERKPKRSGLRENESFGPSPLLSALSAIENAKLVDEMLKYRFKSREKYSWTELARKLSPP